MNETLDEQVLEVKKVLRYLNVNNVEYSILDPISSLCEIIKTDLDLYVDKNSLDAFHDWLILDGWKKNLSSQFSGIRVFYFKFIDGFKVKLDISSIYCVYKGHAYFKYKAIPKKAIDKNGIVFLDVVDYFHFALKKMQHDNTSPHKIQKLKILVQENPLLLSEYSNLDSSNILSFGRTVDAYFLKKCKGKINLFNLVKIYFNRLLPSRSEINIAFIGLDGAGKGTYKELFKESLIKNNYLIKEVYLGYSQYRIPALNYFNEMQVTTKNIIMLQVYRMFFLLFLPFEFILRKGRGRYDLIIMDRHPDFEPIFARTSSLNFYNKLLSFLAPNIDKVFFLTGDLDTLWERKKEMSKEQYKNKSNILKQSINLTAPEKVIKINTCEGIKSSYNKIWASFRNEL